MMVSEGKEYLLQSRTKYPNILTKTQMVAETQIKQAMDKIESLVSGMTDNSELGGT